MNEVKSVSIEDSEYPAELKKIKDAPKILYYRGTLPNKGEKCVAIVGTRRNSAYGQQVTLKISGELTDAGITVVSGLAQGIDTFASKAAVERKQRTIAVLGSGLDEKSLYPKANIDLSRKILEYGGCLISELPEGTSASKFSFPKRNRIISGLSLGVVIVEAKEKSGSLITADYAKKQNKKLFAVPGPIYSLNSKGTNQLIKEGATLVEAGNDILKALGLGTKQAKITSHESQDKEEKLILEALAEHALSIDKIIETTKLPASIIATKLALMEISGKIRNLGANMYALN